MPAATALSSGRSKRWWFAASGLLILAACVEAPVLLPYPLWVAARWFDWRLPERLPFGRRLAIATLGACLVLEVGAWAHNFLRDAPDPALFHPQLLPDLLIAVGFYAGWWLAWWRLLRRWRFSIAEVFAVAATYGVFIEQQGQVFLLGLRTLPTGLVLWAFVALAYGATMALACTWAGPPPAAPADRPRKYAYAWIAMFVCSIGLLFLWNLPLQAFDLIPPERLPMRAHPLW